MQPKQTTFEVHWDKSLEAASRKQTSTFYSTGWTVSIIIYESASTIISVDGQRYEKLLS